MSGIVGANKKKFPKQDCRNRSYQSIKHLQTRKYQSDVSNDNLVKRLEGVEMLIEKKYKFKSSRVFSMQFIQSGGNLQL